MYNTQLETFITAADLGSFNKAAEALYISAPAVTKQIDQVAQTDSTANLVQLFIRNLFLVIDHPGKSGFGMEAD